MSKKISCIGFDFDGVIVDSNEIKEQAFLDIFRNEAPDHYDDLVAFHAANPTLSRSPTMRGAIREVLGQKGPEADEKISHWVSLYTQMTRQRVTDCPYIDGAHEFLTAIKSKDIPMMLASATPEYEVLKIVEARDLNKFFRMINGAPIDKAEKMREFSASLNIEIDQFLYIGDSGSDWTAARDAGAQFIGIDQGKKFPGFSGSVFENHWQLREFLKTEFSLDL